VDVKKLQALLKKDPLLDGSTAEVLTDNDDSMHVTFTGDWKRITTGGYGPSFSMTEISDEEKKILFKPSLKVSGNYNVYAYFPKINGLATQTHIIVFDGKISKDIYINKSDVQVEGQTSGEWVSLGKFKLQMGTKAFVTITNKNTDGAVVADAVLFKPAK
jgi:hypothetical protein